MCRKCVGICQTLAKAREGRATPWSATDVFLKAPGLLKGQLLLKTGRACRHLLTWTDSLTHEIHSLANSSIIDLRLTSLLSANILMLLPVRGVCQRIPLFLENQTDLKTCSFKKFQYLDENIIIF